MDVLKCRTDLLNWLDCSGPTLWLIPYSPPCMKHYLAYETLTDSIWCMSKPAETPFSSRTHRCVSVSVRPPDLITTACALISSRLNPAVLSVIPAGPLLLDVLTSFCGRGGDSEKQIPAGMGFKNQANLIQPMLKIQKLLRRRQSQVNICQNCPWWIVSWKRLNSSCANDSHKPVKYWWGAGFFHSMEGSLWSVFEERADSKPAAVIWCCLYLPTSCN